MVAVLLGFLGTWEGQLRRGLVELADFPGRRHGTFEEAARDSLRARGRDPARAARGDRLGGHRGALARHSDVERRRAGA